ncbi:ABC transporter ATP-binding protein [Coprothermobacter platensis]|uniref:ABC transporter ATP-binding protein n=1 Tax=Coprothermobacter platensis TaxID=108819 RepID=UPI00036443A5|nr:ABC transporter ATP-binding protein [Coprothermobacter platensis]
MARVYLEQVWKKFGNVEAVKDLTLEVNDGEFFVLLGPSGCGKTTTLRMIAGLEDVTKGTIFIGDRVVNDVHPKDRDIAMVFQNYALYPHMSVYDNISFGLKLRGLAKDDIKARVDEVASWLGLSELLNRRPRELSGGQRQRVALARALVRQPKVFLMDEPLSNLDAKLRTQARGELLRLHKDFPTTTIYVTHDQVEAMTLGDRVAVMMDGSLQQVDNPQMLYLYPSNQFVAGFVGTPPMNFVEVSILNENGQVYLQHGTVKLPVTNDMAVMLKEYSKDKAMLGIRPQDVHLADETRDIENNDWILHCESDVAERLGTETYVHFTIDDFELVGRVSAVRSVTMGAAYDVYVDLSGAHVFDSQTGVRVCSGTSPERMESRLGLKDTTHVQDSSAN